MLSRAAPIALLLWAVASLSIPAPGHAQIVNRFGVKAGIVSASASAEFSADVSGDQFERRTGFSASVFAEKRVLPFLSVVGEVGYVQRGFVEKLDHYIQRGVVLAERYRSVKANSRMDYLTIPLMVKLNHRLEHAELYATAGPRIDILLNRETGWFDLPDFDARHRSSTAYHYGSSVAGGRTGHRESGLDYPSLKEKIAMRASGCERNGSRSISSHSKEANKLPKSAMS